MKPSYHNFAGTLADALLRRDSRNNSSNQAPRRSVSVKRLLLLLPSLMAFGIATSFSVVRAATITVVSPTAGSTLNCTVGASVSITFAKGEAQSDAAVLQITDNLGHLSTVYLPNNGGTAGTWDTTTVPMAM